MKVREPRDVTWLQQLVIRRPQSIRDFELAQDAGEPSETFRCLPSPGHLTDFAGQPDLDDLSMLLL